MKALKMCLAACYIIVIRELVNQNIGQKKYTAGIRVLKRIDIFKTDIKERCCSDKTNICNWTKKRGRIL